MIFAKTAFIVSLFALGNIVAAAEPPACLLAAVGPEPNPANLKNICVTKGDEIQTRIRDLCGDNANTALQSFADTCADGGHKITINSPSTTISGSTSTTSGSESSQTGFTTTTGTPAGVSGSPSPTETPSSGSSDRQVSAAAFAAVVFVGFAATL